MIINESTFLECINNIYTKCGRILNFLKANKNSRIPIYSKAIQKAFHIDKSTGSNQLTTLDRLGLIKRKYEGIDKAITITELGELFIQ